MRDLGRPSALAKARSRGLRRNLTEAEKKLWLALRTRIRLEDGHFRRQTPIGPYIVDFCCHSLKLVIECDGGQHGSDEALEHDATRDRYLFNAGYRVMRFWNHEIMTNLDGVAETIFMAVEEQSRRQKLRKAHE